MEDIKQAEAKEVKIEDYANFFRLISNESRYKAVKELLKDENGIFVNEIADRGQIPRSKISDQLMVLRRAGLVNSEKRSNKMYYFLIKDEINKKLKDYLSLAKNKWQGKPSNQEKLKAAPIEIFSSLANDTRCEIFLFLSQKEMFVNEVCDSFYLEQPTVSIHLNQMKKVGLLSSYKKSLNMLYRSNLKAYEEAVNKFLGI
jgi:ArsR family transcriptional regulator